MLATKPAGFGAAEAGGGGEFAGADVLGALPSGSPSRLSSLPLSAVAAAAAAGLYHGQRDETHKPEKRDDRQRLQRGRYKICFQQQGHLDGGDGLVL